MFYLVKLPENTDAQADQISNGYLAVNGMPQRYRKEEAERKAEFFNGTIEKAEDLGLSGLPVRFFMWDEDADQDDADFIECSEADFLAAEGTIEYERDTVFANGVAQICLTKNPYANC